MITEHERKELVAAWGAMRDRPGWAEEQVAGLQTLRLLGELLVEMDGRGISQADLGRAMGVHRRQILRWLRGDGAIKAETLLAIGRHVGLRLDAKWVPVEAGTSIAEPCDHGEAAHPTELALAA